jgi:capsular exopolysaccharide synthesis family protein
VANVWKAITKHQAEQSARAKQKAPSGTAAQAAAPSGRPEAAPASAGAPLQPIDTVKGDGYSPFLKAYHDRGGKITEEYRALRTNLLAQCNDRKFCYMVTSSNPEEGKTVTCLNLAIVMAERVDHRTVAVDCDLRRGKAATLLGAAGSPGVAELLRGEATLKDVTQTTAFPNLFFIPSGKAEADEVGKLMGRPELDETVEHLRKEYDYVLFDTPPINIASDAGMLGRAAGEALLVVRMNKTHRESVDRAVALLHAANVKPAGIILTHQKYHIPSYLYRYS